VGAQGGSRIITAVFQVLSNVVDFDMGVGQAVGAARFHHQHLPDEISLEPGAFTREVWDALRARGHKLAWTKWPIGSAPAIVRKDGQWTGAVDPRIGGLAMGY
jgi:gamma-glutamyltranspeptidase/glutathione hydrolase